MADTTVVIVSDVANTKKRIRKRLTKEDSYYLRKIEQLANQKLRFFRDKELREQQETNNSNAVMSTRPWPTSVRAVVCRPVVRAQDGRKKRRVTKIAAPKPAVINNEVTERLKAYILNEMKGTDMRLVIQKKIYTSDTKKVLNRLNMPFKQLETNEFLTADEKRILKKKRGEKGCEKDGEIEVPLLGPTLEMYKDPMNLRVWSMVSTENYVLTTNWYRFRSKNKLHLKRNSKIQVWSFRLDQKLCFAVACVEEPAVEVDDSDS